MYVRVHLAKGDTSRPARETQRLLEPYTHIHSFIYHIPPQLDLTPRIEHELFGHWNCKYQKGCKPCVKPTELAPILRDHFLNLHQYTKYVKFMCFPSIHNYWLRSLPINMQLTGRQASWQAGHSACSRVGGAVTFLQSIVKILPVFLVPYGGVGKALRIGVNDTPPLQYCDPVSNSNSSMACNVRLGLEIESWHDSLYTQW